MAAQRGGKAYFIASSVGQVSALLRFAILSRLLGPEQLGLAATVILTGQFFDSLTDSGADRFLIQDPEGDDPKLQQLVQLLLSGRGVITAVALVLLAGPIAVLYGAPGLAPGIALLALSPLVAGFIHMDMRRQQRHHDFRTESLALVLSETLATAVAAAAALYLRSFLAAPIALAVRSLVLAAVSHARAERPYRLGFEPADAGRLALFAAPLMLNGLLLFLGGQGDRVVVANRLGPTELGEYSVVTLLAFYPVMTLARYMGNIHLPRVAGARATPRSGSDPASILDGQVTVLAILTAVGFAVAAPAMITILFGAKYAAPGLIVALVGILQAFRFVRMVPTTIALAQGRSGVVLVSNIVRLVAFPGALVASTLRLGLPGIIAAFVLGEIAAQLVALAMIRRADEPAWVGFDRLAFVAIASLVVIGWELALAHATILGLVAASLVSAVAIGAVAAREQATIGAACRTALGFWRTRMAAR